METRKRDAETSHTAMSSQRCSFHHFLFANFSTTFWQQPHFTTSQHKIPNWSFKTLGAPSGTRTQCCSLLLLWGGRLALRHHRSFSATSYCWLICSEGSICRVDKVLNMTRCSWVAEDVCSIRSDAHLAQFRQQDCALCVVLRTNQ